MIHTNQNQQINIRREYFQPHKAYLKYPSINHIGEKV